MLQFPILVFMVSVSRVLAQGLGFRVVSVRGIVPSTHYSLMAERRWYGNPAAIGDHSCLLCSRSFKMAIIAHSGLLIFVSIKKWLFLLMVIILITVRMITAS